MDLARKAGLEVTDRHVNCKCFLTGHFRIKGLHNDMLVLMNGSEVSVMHPERSAGSLHCKYDVTAKVDLTAPDSIEALSGLFARILDMPAL